MKKLSKIVLGPEKLGSHQLPPEHAKFLLGGYDGDDDCDCVSFGACTWEGCRCCCRPGCKKRCPNGGK